MTRSSSRARTTERGFVLLAAIVLAVLYFGLMELLLLDSARELREAQRFRSLIVAAAVAENAAEHMALGIVANPRGFIREEDEQGKMTARMSATGLPGASSRGFTITADGDSKGVMSQHAKVVVRGAVEGTHIRIEFTMHSK